MKKRYLIYLLLTAMLAGLLAGCSAKEAAPETAAPNGDFSSQIAGNAKESPE